MEPSLDFRNPFATASAISVTHEVALQSFSLQPLKRWANHMRKVWPTRKKGPRFRGGGEFRTWEMGNPAGVTREAPTF